MTDEIELLRTFRGDTPEPSEAAWEKARAAIALVPTGAPAPAGPLPRQGDPRPAARPRPWHRRRLPERLVPVATLIGVAAVMIAAVLATVLAPPPALTGPLTTAWQAARPLPGGPHGVQAPSGAWRLAAYLVARDWQTSTAGPEPGALTCPTAATCYVEGNDARSASGPADLRTLYVSADGARTWSVLPLPEDVTFTSALACASATSCAAGGLYAGHQAVYLSTTDGGHSWTVRPLAPGAGQVLTLECATATRCQGLAAPPERPVDLGFSSTLFGAHFVVTTDGGRHLTGLRFPAGEAIQSVACPTATHCVAIGVPSRFTQRDGPDFTHGVLLTSDDGGLTWQRHAWPKGYGVADSSALSCQDATHCTMLGYVMRDGTVHYSYGDGGSATESDKDAIQYSVVAFSADGGVTWTAHSMPRSIPYPVFDALTCPTVQTCYAAGSDDIPQHIGNTYNASSAVVAYTGDAGRTWQRVSFDVPAQVPGGMQGDSFMDIGQLQCPEADACVALGISDQGSTSTPVYTNHG